MSKQTSEGWGLLSAIRASQPSAWLLSALPFAVTYLLHHRTTSLIFWLGLAYFGSAYNFLIHGTDYLSTHGLADAGKRRALVFSILLLNLPLAAALIWLSPLSAQLWLGATILAALFYGLRGVRFKDVPLLDGLTAGFLVASPLIFALLVCAWRPTFLPAAAALASWGAAGHIFSKIADIHRDRQEGRSTTATLLGPRASVVLVCTLFTFSAATVLFSYGQWGGIAAALLSLYLLNSARFIGVSNPELFESGWRVHLKLNYIAAIILLTVLVISQS